MPGYQFHSHYREHFGSKARTIMSVQGNFKIAVAQMTSVDRVADNLEFILQSIRQAGAQSAQLLVFPENSLYLRLSPAEKLWHLEVDSSESSQIAKAVE